jgi:DeoR/GlpR family transcriptional regulator of sugar metabolism
MHPRHSVILELVNERGRIAVVELAEQVGVSEVTIRQDLNYLEDQGFLKRIHGAATRVDSDDPDHRLWARSKIKLNLAEKAASLVSPGETVLIEGGSANALLAKLLGERVTQLLLPRVHILPISSDRREVRSYCWVGNIKQQVRVWSAR